jgi:hypothetical protein
VSTSQPGSDFGVIGSTGKTVAYACASWTRSGYGIPHDQRQACSTTSISTGAQSLVFAAVLRVWRDMATIAKAW